MYVHPLPNSDDPPKCTYSYTSPSDQPAILPSHNFTSCLFPPSSSYMSRFHAYIHLSSLFPIFCFLTRSFLLFLILFLPFSRSMLFLLLPPYSPFFKKIFLHSHTLFLPPPFFELALLFSHTFLLPPPPSLPYFKITSHTSFLHPPPPYPPFF